MRITDSMRYDAVSFSTEQSAQQLYQATQTASTGLRVGEPEDDPVAYAEGTEESASIAQITARQTAVTSAAGDLSIVDDTLSSAEDLLSKAKDVALQMANGDASAADRADAATQIDGLESDLVGLANTQGSHGYLFGGTATGAAPFAPDGTFAGNDDTIGVEV